MHCIDDDTANPTEPRPNGRLGRLSLLFTLVAPATWLAACSSPMPPPVAPPPAAPRPWPNATPRPPAPGSSVRNWDEYRQRAAQRLVSANPDITYTGAVPEPLLAIPVLSVELNSDGSIAKIDVMRYPSQAKDTTQIAIDAVRRAAPFGYVGNLPKPWKYVETFLFDDNRRFKPVTLDR